MVQQEINFDDKAISYDPDEVVENVTALIQMHRKGELGGATMPEDARPETISESSKDNYHF
ncbi:MAG: hypothetical protein R3C44_18545 [Chloroflexota bacterium]